MIFETLTGVAFGAVLSLTGYGAKKIVDIDKKQAAHEAADKATFESFHRDIAELKAGLGSGNAKLDRLIEHMLENPASTAPRRARKR